NQAGVKTIIDPKKQDFTLFKGADLVTPNRAELQQATGLAVNSDDAITIAARQLLQKSQINALLVTRSEQGMSYISHDTVYHIPAQILTVFDVAGAGDTVIAAMALALAGGAPIKNAMEFANITAAVSVSKQGTATVTPQEILRFAPHKRIKTIAEKMMNETDALSFIDSWRTQGLSIGFTNGCFDILHAGHVFSLSEAASRCDRLIVGLNADESVKRLKGDDRPLNDENHRALVLAGLQAVDGIVIFGDDTPFALIQKIMPDKLFKGEDYQIDQIVGADIVQANGGTVERIALMDNLSTTKLIDKMRG
nr:D-glycero-beta-D-manno-heptose 1-phosphate adenylyltransferase [Alphaproteobacteria bacterium]